MSTFAEQLKAKQQEVMGRIVIGHALETQEELGDAVAALAAANGWSYDVSSKAKGQPRAQQKVTEKYGGDWFGIKDMSRCTIVIENSRVIDNVLEKVRKYFIPRNGWGHVQTKPPKGDDDPYGYSDWKLIVKTRGYMAEIQINTKAMIYAKSLSGFRKICAKDEAKMKASHMIPGGLGHQMYAIWRVNPAANGHVAAVSRRYYEYFRSGSGMLADAGLRGALMALNLNTLHT